ISQVIALRASGRLNVRMASGPSVSYFVCVIIGPVIALEGRAIFTRLARTSDILVDRVSIAGHADVHSATCLAPLGAFPFRAPPVDRVGRVCGRSEPVDRRAVLESVEEFLGRGRRLPV